MTKGISVKKRFFQSLYIVQDTLSGPFFKFSLINDSNKN